MAPRRPADGQLSLVATPIGNLADISARATDCLRRADRILAEDTRRARALLTHLGIEGKRVERLDAHAERRRLERWVARLLAGEWLALVSDAGTPLVADPGAALVRAAAAAGVAVTPIPGPSAVLAALAASGLVGGGFRFFGFLPRSGGARRRAIARVVETQESVVLFESPRRLQGTLRDLAARQPDREAVVAREITKLHEQFLRGRLADLAPADAVAAARGEVTVVLGAGTGPAAAPSMDDDQLEARLTKLLGEGLRPKEAAKTLARETGLATREVYDRVVGLRRRRER